jgi:hypothetical protein
MLRVVVTILLVGCGTDSPGPSDAGGRCTASTTSAPCEEAVNHAEFSWLHANVFTPSCEFSGCHDVPPSQGPPDPDPFSYDHLVSFPSKLDPSRTLVVPSDVPASYLMLMLGDYPASMATPPTSVPSVGLMPEGAPGLCCQKLDVFDRWILAGAPKQLTGHDVCLV